VKVRVQMNTAGLRRELQRAGKRAAAGVAIGLVQLGNEVMTDAKQRAPVDLGAMRGSGYVSPAETRGNRVTVETGFGGPAKDYVIQQHEDLSLNHPVGEAKFLERAFDAAAPGAGEVIAKAVRSALGGA
jgi:hypothetical protein